MRKTTRRGFTVVELLVTTLVALVVMAAAYAIYVAQSKSYIAVDDQAQSLQSARVSLEQLTREMRMAGFGVVGIETVTDAKTDTITFRGDIDSDVSTVLASAAAAGATQLLVNLDDTKDTIEAGDYIFLHSGSTVEMVPVDAANPVDLSSEPDKIKLGRGLVNAFDPATTIVKSVETTTYAYNFGTQTLSKNGVATASNIANFSLRYLNENGTELAPATMSSLTQDQRASVRRIEISLETRSALSEGRTKSYSTSVDLRNMGNRGFSIDQCAPNPPTNLSIIEDGVCGQFRIGWTPPAANSCNGSAVTDLGGYKVVYGESGQGDFTPAYNISDGAASESVVKDARLAHGVTYNVRMIAYDTSFNESNDSTGTSFTLEDTERPAPPTGLDATAGVAVVNLVWTASASPDAIGYRVYRSTSAGFTPSSENMIADENTLGESDTSFSDTTAQPCTTYYYKLTTVDCVGEGEASDEAYGDGSGGIADAPVSGTTDTTASESTATPPAKPNPFGSTGGDKTVQLQWTNPADADFDHVVIRWSTGTTPMTMTQGTELTSEGGAPGETKSFTHDNLTNGTWYFYSAWACDRCGNCGERISTSAKADARSPVVEITAPTEGTIVTNGQLPFQAMAYDPDETTLSNPPVMATDNGKGITTVIFHVTPDTGTYQFPRSEMVKQYCGFGGDGNPCPTGDVSQWCSGDYDLWVYAVDNESQYTQSPYRRVKIQNGGVEKDESYGVTTSGNYHQIVTTQLKNTTATTAKVKSLDLSWDRADAKLKTVKAPSGTTIWTASPKPMAGPVEIEIPYAQYPQISSNGTLSIELEFARTSTTLSMSATQGSTTISVASVSGIKVGDVLYIGDSSPATATVASILGTTVTLSAGISKNVSMGERVGTTAADADMNMKGAKITAKVGYELSSYGRTCDSSEMEWVISSAPLIAQPFQDKPAADTAMSTTVASIQVPEYRPVPIHVAVTDYSGTGIASTKLYYKVDTTMSSTAPSSGYATLSLAYDSGDSRWEGTIPSSADARIWMYIVATDGNGATARKPDTGAYTYDLANDTTAPACPMGLVGTVLAKKEVLLQWSRSAEEDVAGYNIYRRANCGAWAKKYTLISDQNTASPDVIDYTDTFSSMNTDNTCYGYYIQAVDYSGNASANCAVYLCSAGRCPCGS